MSGYADLLAEIEQCLEAGLTPQSMAFVMEKLGAPSYPPAFYEEFRLWSDHQPKAQEFPLTVQQRYWQILWETLDKTPLGLSVPFAIPFRQMLARRMFKRCGKNLICSDAVRITYGQFLEVGDDVMLTLGCFFDTKGGIAIGNHAVMAENVTVFTHAHSEADHRQRRYARVMVGDYARVGAGSTLMPGITVGEKAIVAAGAIVTKDVPAGMVAMGAPAKVLRPRRDEGHEGADLGHVYFAKGAFQEE